MGARNLIGSDKSQLATPCLLLDIDAVDHNIDRMASFFAPLECKLRPHAKTHKLPLIARKQIKAGAIGITCAKLQDARAFAQAGIDNILISNQIVGPEKIQELVDLSRLARVIVCIDDCENAAELSKIAQKNGLVQDVLIEVNVGIDRCGVSPGEASVEFLQKISSLKGIRFRGLMGYEGGLYSEDADERLNVCRQRNQALIKTKDLAEAAGFTVEIVSAGGTNTYDITGQCPGITEVQPGSYVTMDYYNSQYGLDFEQALTVLASVISRPAKNRAVIDTGLKALSTDCRLPKVLSPQGVTLEALNEEHGKLILDDSAAGLALGQKVEIIPSHGCTTVPLYDKYILMREGRAVDQCAIISGGAVY